MIIKYLIIILGGGLGAASRAGFSSSIYTVLGRSFPYGILACNVLGCFIMGILATYLLHKLNLSEYWKDALLTGFLGGFTTFSSFSLDAMQLLQQGESIKALIYIASSVILCIIAVFAGMMIVNYTTSI